MRHLIDMLEAKIHLPELVDSLESGHEREFVISRNGRPAARLVPLAHDFSHSAAPVAARRIGIAKGRFEAPGDIDSSNELIQKLFAGH